jgi:hypothetical protein
MDVVYRCWFNRTTSVVVNTTETAARIHFRSAGGLAGLAVLSSCLGKGGIQ